MDGVNRIITFIKLLSAFILLGYVFSWFVSPVQAASTYTVKQYIVIPSDKEVSADLLEKYIAGAEVGIAEVQNMYAKTLEGKTFTVKPGIEVIKVPQTLGNKGEGGDIGDLLDDLHLTQHIPYDTNNIPIVYIIGSGSGGRVTVYWSGNGYNQLVNARYSFVLMREMDLLNMASMNTKYQDLSHAILAHELGHAFGLVNSSCAREHTCSQASPEQCTDNATKPLPNREEGLTDIMYWKSTETTSLKNNFFHNTSCNPEVQKLYENPFLNSNPQGEKGPTPIDSINSQEKPLIVESDKFEAKQGDIITIKGSSFGKDGSVFLYNENYAQQYFSNIIPIEAIDNKITFKIGQNDDSQDTVWDIYVKNSDNIWSDKSISLILKPTISSPVKNSPTIVQFYVTCGANKKSLAKIQVAIKDETNREIISTESTFSTTSLGFIPESGKSYFLVSPTISGTYSPENGYEKIPIKLTSDLRPPIAINYLSCPPDKPAFVVKKPIESITVNGLDWDYLNNPEFPLHILGDLETTGIYYIPVVIIYADGSTSKTVTLTFHYDPNVSLLPTQTQTIEGENSEDGLIPKQSSGVVKQCTFNERFTDEFHGCSSGLRECLGKKGEKGCRFEEGFTDPDDCRVIKCDDDSFTPEQGHKIAQPTEEPQSENPEKPGACERDTFYGCANRCNDNGQAYEIWGCSNETRKQETLNEDTNSDCAKSCNKMVCQATYYYDDNVSSCIHKRPLEDDPSECSFDPVADSFCGR